MAVSAQVRIDTAKMTPMSEEELEQPAVVEQRSRRWPWVAAAAVIAVGLLGFFLIRSGDSFEDLVDVTQQAEGDQIWIDYFVAQDCFFVAVLEDGDIELAFTESQDLLTQTDSLARHVGRSLESFAGLRFGPARGELERAREAIVAHYEVWDDHLAETAQVLAAINSEPSSVVAGAQSFAELASAAFEPIEATFNEAGAEFREAAGEDQTALENLFEPADVSCTRTAV